MSDLPFQGILQQNHARPFSGEELEALGKKAADYWASGRAATLNEAVVETVKHAGLSPEQVRRVIEFTNISAFLNEFKKEGAPHRVIEFPGGPADPGAVLQDLNDGGGGSVFDAGTFDYDTPPVEVKIASAAAEEEFDRMFGSREDSQLPFQNPLGDAIDLRDKLAAIYDNQTAVLSGLEGVYLDLTEQLYGHVKQAALNGYSLGDLLQAWQPFIDDPEYIKVAFATISPRLVGDGVFHNADELATSCEKVASRRRLVNAEHPLVQTMVEWAETLTKIAYIRAQRDEIKRAYDEITAFIKTAGNAPDPGLIKKITNYFAEASVPVADYAGRVGKFLLGEESPHVPRIQNVAGKLVKYTPHIIGAGLAVRGAQHLSALSQSPTAQTVASFIPGTSAYEQKQMELNGRFAGYPYPVY